MRLGLVLQLFLASSRVQRKRAVLTIASIAWGSVALLLLLAFGEGLKQQLSRGSAGMGTNLAVLWMGETSKPWQGMPAGRPIRPRVDDVNLLRERIPGLVGIVAEMRNWRTGFTYGSKTVNGRLTGSSPEYGEMRNYYAEPGGRFTNALDEAEKRRVIFLGNERAKEIFGDEDPVGKTLLVNQVPFTVIGVMKRKIQMGTYGGPDAENALIPLSTFVAMYGSDRVGNIVLKPEQPAEMARVLADVHKILGAKYGFDPTDEKVFPTWDTVQSGSIMRNILLGIQLFLGVIGALTLMIGGVGVANIMYATVKERTREIGV
jgi:putative ABC transport system permease protein